MLSFSLKPTVDVLIPTELNLDITPSCSVQPIQIATSGCSCDLTSFAANADNGLSKVGDTIQLGQLVGAVGDPAKFTGGAFVHREIPLGDSHLILNNKTGASVGIYPASITFDTAFGAFINITSVLGGIVNYTFSSSLSQPFAAGLSFTTIGSHQPILANSGVYWTAGDKHYDIADILATLTSAKIRYNTTDLFVVNTDGSACIACDGTNLKVAVGHAAPTDTLHIQGSFRLVNGTEGNLKILQSNATGVGTWADGAGLFILNQFAGAQTVANWWISGHGRVDDYLQINDSGRFKKVTSPYTAQLTSLTDPTDSRFGMNLAVNKLFFHYGLDTGYAADSHSSAHIKAGAGGAGFLDIVAPANLNLFTPGIQFTTSKTADYPAILMGGLYPLKISGSSAGQVGIKDYIDLVNGFAAGAGFGSGGEGTNVRILFSANRTTGGKTSFGRIGIEVMDFSNATYKGDLVFETGAYNNTVDPYSGTLEIKLRLRANGELVATGYASGLVAPVTTGTKHMVTVDSLGLLSHEAIPGGGGGGTPSAPTNSIQYNNAGAFGGAATLLFDGLLTTNTALALGTTQVDTKGILLTNTTAAVAGLQQISPSIHWNGRGWKTTAAAASQSVDYRAYVLPVQGTANPSATWTLQSSINGGAYSNSLSVDSFGTIAVGTSGVGSTGNVLSSNGASASASWLALNAIATTGLTNGSGTTASGTFVDWNGALTANAIINGASEAYGIQFNALRDFKAGDNTYTAGLVGFDHVHKIWIGDYNAGGAGQANNNYLLVDDVNRLIAIKAANSAGDIRLFSSTIRLATAVNGYIWTLSNNATGGGEWTAAPGTSLTVGTSVITAGVGGRILFEDPSHKLNEDVNLLFTGTGGAGLVTTGNLALISTHTTEVTTASILAITANSLTTGTGAYLASTSISSGRVIDIQVNGTAAITGQTGINIKLNGANGTASQVTYGLRVSNTHTGTTPINWSAYFDERINVGGGTNDTLHVVVIKSLDNTTSHGIKIYSNDETSNLIIGFQTIQASGNLILNSSVLGVQVQTKLYVGAVGTTPTAILHLLAGTTAATTAPLKFTSGALMTAAEAGAIEYINDDIFLTIATATARKRLLMAEPSGGLSSTRIPFVTTNGRLTDDSSLTYGVANGLSVSTTSTGSILSITGAITPGAGSPGFITTFGGGITEAGSGTHSILASVAILAPIVTVGAAAVTNAATLYISGTPNASGANNSAIWAVGTLRLGQNTIAGGVINIEGVTSGFASLVVSGVAGTPVLTLPTITGTLVQFVEISTASATTPAPSGDARENFLDVTALAVNTVFGAPTGTAANHNIISIRIKDNGTARTLGWNAIYRGSTDIALPLTTVINLTMYTQFMYNSADGKWDLVGLTRGF